MLKKILFMFGIGGGIYVLLELLVRSRSHISMFFAGGFSTALIFSTCCIGRRRQRRWYCKCLIGSGIITVVELLTGVIVNLWLRLQVWDYSAMPWNLWGQICLPFSLLWFVLTLPVLLIGNLLTRPGHQSASSADTNRPNPLAPSSSGR